MIEQLLARLMFLRTVSHIAHLKTSSYAQHMALGDFYGAIGDHADAIAEAWMGRNNERIADVPIIAQKAGNVVQDLWGVRSWIDVNRKDKELASPEIQNLIDGATDLIDSTLYKLKFLS